MIKKYLILNLIIISSLFSQQNEIQNAKSALEKGNYNEVISLISKFSDERSVGSEVNLLLGSAYLGKNDLQKSKEYFDRALNYDEENMKARAGFFLVKMKLKEFDKLQKFLADGEKIVKRNKETNFYEYFFDIGNDYYQVDSIDKAILNYSKSKELNSNFIGNYSALAVCYEKQGVPSMAIENYKIAAEIDKSNATYLYNIGKIQYKNRQYSEAAKYFNDAIKLEPTNQKYLVELADLFFRAKLWKDAANTYEKYNKLNQTDESILENFVRSQYGARMYKEVVPNLEKLLKKKSNQELQLMMGHSYYEIGEFEKSANYYKQIPIDSIKKTSDLINFGRSLVKMKDTTNALFILDKATKIDTNSIEVAGDLAAIFIAQKNFSQATVQYEKILSVDPKNISALFYSGFAYSVDGKIDSAKNKFLQVTLLRPNYLQGRLFLMKMYVELEKEVEAKYEAAIILTQLDSSVKIEADKKKVEEKIYPNYIDLYRSLAILEYKQKKYQLAVELLNKALIYESKTKKDESLHLFLAQMLNISGDKVNAKKEYDVVLKINPKNATAKKEKSQIQL